MRQFTPREKLVMEWSRHVVAAGYANDLPESFLPKHLKFNQWCKARKIRVKQNGIVQKRIRAARQSTRLVPS